MLGSNVNNIRFNGTGRVYMGAVAGSSLYEIGELESLAFGMSVSTEKLSSNRNAARATILEVESEREANLNLGLRELSEQNLQVALLGGTINADNQSASYADQVVPTYVDDQFVDLHDPEIDVDMGETVADKQYLPVDKRVFSQISRYGRNQPLQAAVIVGPKRPG